MGPKTISLDEEAYERLKARKREGERFSDVVKRLAAERPLSELAGVLSDAEGDALADATEEGRERSRHRVDDLAEELSER